MAQVSVLKIHEANQLRPLLQETIDLLDSVQARAFEFFERRGGFPGNDVADWLQAEREVFRVPDMELAESGGSSSFSLPCRDSTPKTSASWRSRRR